MDECDNPVVEIYSSSSPPSSLPSFYSVLTETLESRRRVIGAFSATRRVAHPRDGAASATRNSVSHRVTRDEARFSYLEYKKLVKKAKRKMKRRIDAVQVAVEEREARKRASMEDREKEKEKVDEEDDDDDDDDEITRGQKEQDELDEIERKLREHESWLERENEARKEFENKKAAEEKRREEEEAEEKRRAEEELRRETEIRDATEAAAATAVASKPPPPTDLSDPNNCDFYLRTGVCRYGEVCKRLHPEIEVGTKVLIPSMFNPPVFDVLFATPEGDVTLDDPHEELLKAFREFYEDTLPEFRKIGNVRQFKVCSNRAKHLRGNVYVEYEREEEAYVAAQVFGGRWYAGRRLSANVTVVRSWRQAICLDYLRNCCPKRTKCNFFHCFVNPEDEFADADFESEELGERKKKREDSTSYSSTNRSGGEKTRGGGRPPPRRKRTPSPPGKHRPFRFKDHYVEDERIWKKRKEKESDEKESEEKKEVKKRETKDDSKETRKEKKKEKRKESSDSDDDFCERAKKRRRGRSRRSRSSSRGSGSGSGSDCSDGKRSSDNSNSSSDEMEKKILKATLKSIKNKKTKKKSKKSKKKRKKKRERRDPTDSTDSSWESDASGSDVGA